MPNPPFVDDFSSTSVLSGPNWVSTKFWLYGWRGVALRWLKPVPSGCFELVKMMYSPKWFAVASHTVEVVGWLGFILVSSGFSGVTRDMAV